MRKKLLKLFCSVVLCAVLLCTGMAVWAAEEEAANQILTPIGGGYLNSAGEIVLDSDGAQVVLTAEFAQASEATIYWEVVDGREVVSIHKRDNYPQDAILTALADGNATIVAYKEEEGQACASIKVVVSGQEVATQSDVSLSTTVEGDGSIIRTVGDTTVSLGTSYTYHFAPGTEMDLTAQEKTYPFKYWVVRYGDQTELVATTEKNFKFILGTDMTVAAVFDMTDDGSVFGTNITFLYDNIVASNTYVKSVKKTVPNAPYQRNKSFDKWTSEMLNAESVVADGKVEKTEVTCSTEFKATYTNNDAECEITVIGGSGSGTYAYGAPVKVEVSAAAEEGKTFLFWTKDGSPVSYEETYVFSAMQDCTICAVYGTALETDGINMVMQKPVLEGDAIAFTFERYVPDSYTFVSSGIVVSKIANCKLDDATNNLMVAVSQRDGVRTQFTKSLKKVSGVSTYYARGYVIYKDGDVIKTIYTAPQKLVLE